MSFDKIITPEVNAAREFKEIANDFSNPLEIVREAISNAFDAKATRMDIKFSTIKDDDDYNETLLVELIDNGIGMDENGLKSFFDLGNSLTGKIKSNFGGNAIGEKGHGTKIYYNSSRIEVVTIHDGIKYTAVMDSPRKSLNKGIVPDARLSMCETTEPSGTYIKVLKYNNNEQTLFTQDRLKDYILWFTKMGSIEKLFGINENDNFELHLKALDNKESEPIKFGHQFPDVTSDMDKLFDRLGYDAPDNYCFRKVYRGHLENSPAIEYEAIFSIEGTKIKHSYNKMIRRSGYIAPKGAYTIQERYGIYLCKDYLPIQSKNDWINEKGREHTRFHAFVNCQDLRLTANRSSIENTPQKILDDLESEVKRILAELRDSDDWKWIDLIEEQVAGDKTEKQEKKEYERRTKDALKAKIADFSYKENETMKKVRFIEPQSETGLAALFYQLNNLNFDFFDFEIVDYNTTQGIDMLAKTKSKMQTINPKLFYIELKHILKDKHFNHSFEHLYKIVCWGTTFKSDDEITDVTSENRKIQILPPADENDYTHYFLDNPRKQLKIEIIVLEQYLKEKYKIEFKTRPTGDSI